MSIKKLIAPLSNRVSSLVRQCKLTNINDNKQLQEVQVNALGSTYDKLQRLQNYGFTSVPNTEAEGLLLSIGGNSNTSIIVVMDDSRYRITGLESGDVAIYDNKGQIIKLTKDGISIETEQDAGVTIKCKKANIEADETLIKSDKATIEASEAVIKSDNIKLDGSQVQCTGNLEVQGNLTVKGDVALGAGALPVARVGDKVTTPAGEGAITSGAPNVKA